MSLEKYAVFVKVVETGSFTRAAEEMGYTQSGISHAVNSMEEKFGFKLFVRNRSGVKLTSNGERVLQPVKEILKWDERLNQTAHAINGMFEGKIRLGTFESLSSKWLPEVLKRFMDQYPNIEFELIDGDYDQIVQWIRQSDIDCGFVNLSENREDLHVLPVIEDQLLVVLYENHPLAEHEQIPVQALNGEYFILPGEGMNHEVGRMIQEHELDLKVRYHSKNDYVTLNMVRSGLGISVLPELLLDDLPEGIVVRPFETGARRQLGFATLSPEQRLPIVNVFEKYVLDSKVGKREAIL